MPFMNYMGLAVPAGPPPVTDPFFSQVKVLMGFEDSDGSTTFVNECSSGHTFSAVGNAQIDTSQFKFGSASLQCDGSGDCIQTGAGSNADFGNVANTTPWTFECFVRLNATGGDYCVMGKWFNPTGYMWRIQGGNLSFLNFNGTANVQAWSPSTGVWYHIAMDYDGGGGSGVHRLYVDGTMLGKVTAAQSLFDTVVPFAIGAQEGGGGRSLDGRVDEFRYTLGTARYASDAGFSVPTEAYPRS
jgi:hypothetical protein